MVYTMIKRILTRKRAKPQKIVSSSGVKLLLAIVNQDTQLRKILIHATNELMTTNWSGSSARPPYVFAFVSSNNVSPNEWRSKEWILSKESQTAVHTILIRLGRRMKFDCCIHFQERSHLDSKTPPISPNGRIFLVQSRFPGLRDDLARVWGAHQVEASSLKVQSKVILALHCGYTHSDARRSV